MLISIQIPTSEWRKNNYTSSQHNWLPYYPYIKYVKWAEEEYLSCTIVDRVGAGEFKACVEVCDRDDYAQSERAFEKDYKSLSAAKRGVDRYIKNRYKVKWASTEPSGITVTTFKAEYKDYTFYIDKPHNKYNDDYSVITIHTNIGGEVFTSFLNYHNKPVGETTYGTKKEATLVVEKFLRRVYEN